LIAFYLLVLELFENRLLALLAGILLALNPKREDDIVREIVILD
jgi:hypothetical protein